MATVREIREALAEVKDPDFDIGIVEMGLVYDVRVDGAAGECVSVVMTLTSPMCPHAERHVRDVERCVGSLPGVRRVKIDVTFEPPWDPAAMAGEEFKAIAGIW